MAQLDININLLQQQIDGNDFSFRLRKNGVTVGTVTKTFRGPSKVSKTINNMNLVTPQNTGVVSPFNPDTLSFDTTDRVIYGILPVTIGGVQKYYVWGSFESFNGNTSYKKLVRLNADGTIDTAFPSFAFDTSEYILDVKRLGTDRIIVGGLFDKTFNGTNVKSLMIVLDSGLLDTNVNINNASPSTTNNPFIGPIVRTIHIQTEGSNERIYIGGDFSTIKISSGTSSSVGIYSFVRQSNGVILSHSPNTQLNAEGVYNISYSSNSNMIYIGGSFYEISSTQSNLGIINLSSSTINILPGACVLSLGATINTIAPDNTNGGLFIGGLFSSVNGTSMRSIAKLNNSGSLNSSFPNQDIQINSSSGEVRKLLIRNQSGVQKLYVGGRFETVLSTPAISLVKLEIGGGISTDWDTTNVYSGSSPSVQTVVFNLVDIGPLAVCGAALKTFNGYIQQPIESATVVPLGSTLSLTRGNLNINLQTYNNYAGVSYINSGTGTVTLRYTGFTNTDVVVVDNIVEEPSYITITLSDPVYDATQIMLTRSPYFVNLPMVPTAFNANFAVKIFTGNFGTEPSTLNYSLTKPKITADQSNMYFDSSLLVKDFLVTSIDSYLANTTTYTIQPTAANEASWVSITGTTYSSSGGTLNTEKFKFLAIDGYGYTEEGVNPQPPKVLFTPDVVDMLADGNQRLYFNTRGLTSVSRSTLRPSGGIVAATYNWTANSDISTNAISSVRVFTDSAQALDPIRTTYTLTYGTGSGATVITKVFNFVQECKYAPRELYFKNKYGMLQTMHFEKRSDSTLNVDTKTYNRSTLTAQGTYNPRKHTEFVYQLDANEEFTLNTGFLTLEMNKVYQELMLSDEIYMNDNGIIKPVIISDKSWTPKIRPNDKLISYTIKVKVAQSKINNIR